MAPDWFYEPLPEELKKYERSKRPKKRVPSKSKKAASSPKVTNSRLNARIAELNAPSDPDAKLSEATGELLRFGRPGDDQSQVIQEIWLGANAVNFNIGDLFLMLENPANKGGEGLQRRIRERGRDAVIDQWMGVTQRSVQTYRAEQLLMLEEIKESIELHEWTDTQYWHKDKIKTATAKSLLPVLYASLDLAEKYTTTKPMLSKTMIATTTDLSVPTVRSAFHGLEELGWLQQQPERLGAKIYQFLDPAERVNPLLANVEPRPKGMTKREYLRSRKHLATTESITYRPPGYFEIPPELDGILINRPPDAPPLINFD
jgi:hypothetical protein